MEKPAEKGTFVLTTNFICFSSRTVKLIIPILDLVGIEKIEPELLITKNWGVKILLPEEDKTYIFSFDKKKEFIERLTERIRENWRNALSSSNRCKIIHLGQE